MSRIMSRIMSRFVQLDDVVTHPNADALDLVVIGGWQCVVKRGEFAKGDAVLFFEIDSWVPTTIAQFLSKGKEPRTYNDVAGERLRTVRFRGAISQGLALPISATAVTAYIMAIDDESLNFYGSQLSASDVEAADIIRQKISTGEDISTISLDSLLNIQKWERQMPAELAGQVNGLFPVHLAPKSDQNRCQNIVSKIFGYEPTIGYSAWFDFTVPTPDDVQIEYGNTDIPFDDSKDDIVTQWRIVYNRPPAADRNERYEVSMKMDGSSLTGFYHNGETGVCSRNYELKINEENADNAFVKMFVSSGLQDALITLGGNYAVQGELMAPEIQGNREKFDSPKLFIFDVIDTNTATKLLPDARNEFLGKLFALVDTNVVKSVPILHHNVTLDELGLHNVQDLLAYAEGPSLNNPVREGLVFKSMTRDFTWKAISNSYLLGGGE